MTNEEAIKTIRCALGHGCKQMNCDGRYSVDCTDNKVIMVVKLAVSALEKAEKYRWHDLRKNPYDLPDVGVDVLCIDCDRFYIGYYEGNPEIGFLSHGIDVLNPSAWKYIEPFGEDAE